MELSLNPLKEIRKGNQYLNLRSKSHRNMKRNKIYTQIYLILEILYLFVLLSVNVMAFTNVSGVATIALQLDKVDIMPLKDIKVGMKGYGKTVIRGTEIATFNVEIMGILSNNKLNENILISGQSILVRVSGKVIEEAGGIAAGMSGSPIYLNNKIIGGLSSGWIMTDHTIGLVTPIEEMLEILSYANSSKKKSCIYDEFRQPVLWQLHEPVEICNNKVERIWEVNSIEELDEIKLDKSREVVFLRASTPVYVHGLAPKYLEKISRRLKKFNLKPVQLPADSITVGGTNQWNTSTKSTNQKFSMLESSVSTGTKKISNTSNKDAYDTFVPGSALGVQLARGDINLTTIGTLTYRDGKKILAFAHPFLKKGEVSFILTKTHIYHCFSSVQMPFKIGAPTEMIGVITQDREKGIAGELGKFPPLVPIKIEVTDKDLNKSKNINYQIVRDETVFLSVLESTLSQAIIEVADREGGGTALVRINLECVENGKGPLQIRRENLYYSKDGIIETVVGEIVSLFNMLLENEISNVVPTKLDLKVEIENERKTVTIEKVEVLNKSVVSGGILDLEITLRPYRLKPQVRKAKVNLPSNLEKENLIVAVYGNSSRQDDSDSSINISKNQKNAKDEKVFDSTQSYNSLNDLVSNWINAPKNSDIIIKVFPESEELKKVESKESSNVVVEIIPTSLVVLGRVETAINLSEE